MKDQVLELKASVYDLIAMAESKQQELQQIQKKINELNQQIFKLQNGNDDNNNPQK